VTTLEEDRELAAVMKKGVLKLPPQRRARLQALFRQGDPGPGGTALGRGF